MAASEDDDAGSISSGNKSTKTPGSKSVSGSARKNSVGKASPVDGAPDDDNASRTRKKSIGSSGVKPLVPNVSSNSGSATEASTDNDSKAWDGFGEFDNSKNHTDAFASASQPTKKAFGKKGKQTATDPFGDSTSFSDPFADQANWGPTIDQTQNSNDNNTSEVAESQSEFMTQGERIRRAKEAAAAGVTVMAANQQQKMKESGQPPSRSNHGAFSPTAGNLNDETIDILSTKSNYFESEANKLRAEVTQLREERNLLAQQTQDLEDKFSLSVAEQSAMASSVSDSKLLVSQLTLRLQEQQTEIESLKESNRQLASELCSLEVFVAETRIDLRHKNSLAKTDSPSHAAGSTMTRQQGGHSRF
jgi:uncharacterized protein YlxP (DUF503 family)